MRYVIYVEGLDRPGLLRDVSAAISGCDGNILYNVAYGSEGVGYLLFITEYEGSPEFLSDRIKNVKDVYSVDIAELGIEAVDIITKFLEKNPSAAEGISQYMHPEDFTMVLVRLDDDVRRKIYGILSVKVISSLLTELPKELLNELGNTIPTKLLANALIPLRPDDLVDVLQALNPTVRRAVLKLLPKEKVEEIRPLLVYPPETAGGLMTTSIPKYTPDTQVSKVIEDLGSSNYEITDVVYVVGRDGKLLGYVNVPSLFKVNPNTKLEKLIRRDYITVDPLTDQEEVAKLMVKFDITKIPVTDADGKLLGVVTLDDVTDVLLSEESEDMLLFGGVMRVEHYLTARVKDLFKKRFIWILFLYLMENVTARIISSFSGMISKVAILAAFIPLILGTGGNAGSQSAVLVTRALALGELTLKDVLRVLGKELLTALLLALTIAPIAFLFAYGVSSQVSLSIAVALAILLVIIACSIMGGLLPLLAVAIKVDPAVISAPLLTTIADIVGLTIYFITLSIVLGII